jgi:hypothetical protein
MYLLGGTVRRWIALVGLGLTVLGVVQLALQAGRNWAWLAIGGMALLVISLGWTVRDEHQRRVAAEDAPHRPPGDGVPLRSPVGYQVAALHQAIPRLTDAGLDQFGLWELEDALKNLPRRGVDPVYEPLRSCDEGLTRLVELGELEEVAPNGPWRILRH